MKTSTNYVLRTNTAAVTKRAAGNVGTDLARRCLRAERAAFALVAFALLCLLLVDAGSAATRTAAQPAPVAAHVDVDGDAAASFGWPM